MINNIKKISDWILLGPTAKNTDNALRIATLNTIFLLGAAYLMAFFADSFFKKIYPLPYLIAGYALAFAFIGFFIFIHTEKGMKHLNVVKVITALSLMIFYGFLYITIHPHGHIWTFLIPLMIIFIMELKWGVIFCSFYLLFMFVAEAAFNFQLHGLGICIRYACVFFAQIFLAGVYEKLRSVYGERLKAESKAKSDFLAKMSHEIRTPMNAIVGMAELALREDMPDTVKEHVITIKQASANLLSIINDILDFSKIESGKLEIVPSNYLFSSLVNDVISITRMRVMDSKINFAVNIDSGIPNALIGDEVRIRQILLNVLSNAVKYTREGYITFAVSGEIIDDDTVILTIDVTDTGKGIKPEDMDKLFKDFVQLDLMVNKGVEGTGLGLAITKNLINAMHGEIEVASEYKHGSTFTITIPQKISSLTPLAVVENAVEKRVLIYERREIYADSMICAIDNLGVNCERVEDEHDLREKLKAGGYTFIFVEFCLLDDVQKILSEFESKPKIVLLAEFGDVIADNDLSVIAMPVHSISIANVLNGVSCHFYYNTNANTMVRFSAPSARVLIVDDINTNLKVAEGLLLPYKMQVDSRLSGVEAIEAVKTNHYDLVFMDHMMPEMNGIEAAKIIRGLGFNSLPIIALTANAVSGMREMFIENGLNDFLSKPIDVIKLNNIVEKWIPKEKKIISVQPDANMADANAQDEIAADIVIDGVDVKLGIQRTGGTVERYVQTLSVFCDDAKKKIAELKSALNANDLPSYTTYVHALKSALANIGAVALSKSASLLEDAGRQGNRIFIDKNSPMLLADLEPLLINVEKIIAAQKEKQSSQTDFDTDVLKNLLADLNTAIDNIDTAAINAAVRELKPFENAPEIGSAITEILQCVLNGDYGSVTLHPLVKQRDVASNSLKTI